MERVKDGATTERRRRLGLGLAAAGFAVILAVGLRVEGPGAQGPGRIIYLATVELKDGAQRDKEPYPEAALPLGSGYAKTPPNAAGRWEVSAYQWSPGTIVVEQGEAVTLEILGIGGDAHPATIPGLVDSFTVKRGEITRVTFTASKAGLYSIICTKHGPSMRGTLVVLRKLDGEPPAPATPPPPVGPERRDRFPRR